MGIIYFRLNTSCKFLPLNKPSHPGDCKNLKIACASPSPTWSTLHPCWSSPCCPYQIFLIHLSETNCERINHNGLGKQTDHERRKFSKPEFNSPCISTEWPPCHSSDDWHCFQPFCPKMPLGPLHLPSCRGKAQPLGQDAWDRNFGKRNYSLSIVKSKHVCNIFMSSFCSSCQHKIKDPERL